MSASWTSSYIPGIAILVVTLGFEKEAAWGGMREGSVIGDEGEDAGP
jgi:hypothetical protein